MRRLDAQQLRLDCRDRLSALPESVRAGIICVARYWDVSAHVAGEEMQFRLRRKRSRRAFWRRTGSDSYFCKGTHRVGWDSDLDCWVKLFRELVEWGAEPFDEDIEWGRRLPVGAVYDHWRPAVPKPIPVRQCANLAHRGPPEWDTLHAADAEFADRGGI